MKRDNKDWLVEVWKIKDKISRETKDMRFEGYWRYIIDNAEKFLGQTRIKKSTKPKLLT